MSPIDAFCTGTCSGINGNPTYMYAPVEHTNIVSAPKAPLVARSHDITHAGDGSASLNTSIFPCDGGDCNDTCAVGDGGDQIQIVIMDGGEIAASHLIHETSRSVMHTEETQSGTESQ